MRCLVVLLLLVAVVASAFDSVVQIYTKVKIELQYKQETKTEVFVNGQLIERKIDTQYKPKETLELWVMGSGFIVFSGERKNEEFSLIMTNYHVIDLLVEKPSELKALNPCVGVFVNSVTFTYSKDGKLTKFEIKEEGFRLAITNIDGPYLIFYWSYKRNNRHTFEIKGEIFKHDALLDIAVIKLSDVAGLTCAKLAKSVDDYPLGEPIVIFGAPLGIPFQLTRGVLGQKHLDVQKGWIDMLRYDCPQAPGSSGSAIFASDGKVIGVVRGAFVTWEGSPYDGQYLGIAIDNIRDWLFLSGLGYVLEGS